MRKPDIKIQSGFTLVEIMVAMVLSLVLGIAIVTVFVNNSHSFSQDDNVLRMQDDARQSMRELVNDLSMAGYWADLVLPAAITPDGSLAVAFADMAVFDRLTPETLQPFLPRLSQSQWLFADCNLPRET